MFFGWEGVGLASYLLIGFWYEKPSANAAALKAFFVNRVGDVGFALGIAGAFLLLGSVNFDDAFAAVPVASRANWVRVVLLVVLVEWRGMAVLETWMHVASGLLTFALALPVIFWLGMPRGSRDKGEP